MSLFPCFSMLLTVIQTAVYPNQNSNRRWEHCTWVSKRKSLRVSSETWTSMEMPRLATRSLLSNSLLLILHPSLEELGESYTVPPFLLKPSTTSIQLVKNWSFPSSKIWSTSSFLNQNWLILRHSKFSVSSIKLREEWFQRLNSSIGLDKMNKKSSSSMVLKTSSNLLTPT